MAADETMDDAELCSIGASFWVFVAFSGSEAWKDPLQSCAEDPAATQRFIVTTYVVLNCGIAERCSRQESMLLLRNKLKKQSPGFDAADQSPWFCGAAQSSAASVLLHHFRLEFSSTATAAVKRELRLIIKKQKLVDRERND